MFELTLFGITEKPRYHALYNLKHIIPKKRLSGAAESLIDLSAGKPSKVSMSGTVTGKSKAACFTEIIKDIALLQIHQPVSLMDSIFEES